MICSLFLFYCLFVWGVFCLFFAPGAQHQAVMVLGISLATMLPTEGTTLQMRESRPLLRIHAADHIRHQSALALYIVCRLSAVSQGVLGPEKMG